MLIAISIAHFLLAVLILRVASIAARASAPTWSTGDKVFKKPLIDASEPSVSAAAVVTMALS